MCQKMVGEPRHGCYCGAALSARAAAAWLGLMVGNASLGLGAWLAWARALGRLGMGYYAWARVEEMKGGSGLIP